MPMGTNAINALMINNAIQHNLSVIQLASIAEGATKIKNV